MTRFFFRMGKTAPFYLAEKNFRQQIMKSNQNIKDKTLAIKLFFENLKTGTTEKPNHRCVYILRTISIKCKGLLCWKELLWLVNSNTIQRAAQLPENPGTCEICALLFLFTFKILVLKRSKRKPHKLLSNKSHS